MRKFCLHLLFLALVSFGFLGCADEGKAENEIITLDLMEATKNVKNLNLSELVDDVEYVKLETREDCTFGLGRYLVTDNYIVVFEEYKASVLFFSREGKYLRSIGRKGNGPGEFFRVSEVIAFPEEDCLVIYDGGASKLIKYSIKGDLLLEQSYPRNLERISSFSKLGSDYFALVFSSMDMDKQSFNRIQIMDKDFEILDSGFPVLRQFVENSSNFNKISFYLKSKTTHILDNDSLFEIDEGALIPKFHFWIKENARPENSNPWRPEGGPYNRFGGVFELGNYLMCDFDIPGEEEGSFYGYSIVYNQETQSLFTLPELRWYIRENGTEAAIFNDIDGIHHIYMANYTNTPITHFTEKMICKAFDIIDLKSYIEDKTHEEIEVKLPKRQAELIELVEKSELEDNPIVQIFHLK